MLFSLPRQIKAAKAKVDEMADCSPSLAQDTRGLQVEWKALRPDGTELAVIKQFKQSADGREAKPEDFILALDDKKIDQQRRAELVIYENGRWEKRLTLKKPMDNDQWTRHILDLEKHDAALTLQLALKCEQGLLNRYRQQKVLDYEILNTEHAQAKKCLDAYESAGNQVRKLNIKPSGILVSQNPDEAKTKAVQAYIRAFNRVMLHIVTPAGWGKADAQGNWWTKLKSSLFGIKMGFRTLKFSLSPARDAYRQATEAYYLLSGQHAPARWNPPESVYFQAISGEKAPVRIIYRGTNLVKLAAFDAQWGQYRKETTKTPNSIRATRIL